MAVVVEEKFITLSYVECKCFTGEVPGCERGLCGKAIWRRLAVPCLNTEVPFLQCSIPRLLVPGE